mmetsp:Transcript_5447/g.5603  ORF Transcript_5447/g.5603 Transcript_5447/m.5603 type:complete len:153 (+) Transcript_5447:117-575(+)
MALSRRQQWRREKYVKRCPLERFIFNPEAAMIPIEIKLNLQRHVSEPHISTQSIPCNDKYFKRSLTTGDLYEGTPITSEPGLPSNRKIRFHHTVSAVLIPTRSEYEAHRLTNEIWWSRYDFQAFKIAAREELSQLIELKNKSDDSSIKPSMN